MGKGVIASHGLSAVRMWTEPVVSPPNSFTTGGLSFASTTMNGLGMQEVRCGVTNGSGSSGTLRVLGAWLSTGPFIILESKATAVDPLTGHHVADMVVCFTRNFIIVDFVAVGAPGLTAVFQLGAYFVPR